MVSFRQFGRLRRATCVEERHCPGNPAKPRGIPVAPDARGRVETVRAGSALSVLAGHYAITLAERETVRSCMMGKCKRRAEMTRPPAIMAGSNNSFEDISALANLIMLQEMMLGLAFPRPA